MGKIRRGNYEIISRVVDHGNHIHVYKDGRQILKWDLDDHSVLEGKLTRRLRKIIKCLIQEGKL